MAVRQGFGALAEFALGEHSDDIAVTTPVASTDTLSVLATETMAIAALLHRTDAALLALTSAVVLFSTLGRSDATIMLLAEVRTIGTVLDVRSDELRAALTDASSVRADLSRADGAPVTATDTARTIAAMIERSDQLKTIVSRHERGPGFGALAEFAMGEHAGDRSGQWLFSEGRSIFSRVTTRTDALATRLDLVAALLSALARADSLMTKADETGARAEERLHRRIINTIHY